MRHARRGQTVPIVLTTLTVLFAVFLGAHLLTPTGGNASTGSGDPSRSVDVHGSGFHSAGIEDSSKHLRHRTQRRVGNQMEPESGPSGGLAIVVGIGVIDGWRARYRMAAAYGTDVPSRDTSPAALQVYRC